MYYIAVFGTTFNFYSFEAYPYSYTYPIILNIENLSVSCVKGCPVISCVKLVPV